MESCPVFINSTLLGPESDLCGVGSWGQEIVNVHHLPKVPCVPKGGRYLLAPNKTNQGLYLKQTLPLQDLLSLFFFSSLNVPWLPVFLKISATSSSISLETPDLSNISLHFAEPWSIYIPSMTLRFTDRQGRISPSSLPDSLVPVEGPHRGHLDTVDVHQSLLLYFWVCGGSTLLLPGS